MTIRPLVTYLMLLGCLPAGTPASARRGSPLERQIVRNLIGPAPRSRAPTITFVAGGVGSGKTFFLSALETRQHLGDAVYVSSDLVKPLLPAYRRALRSQSRDQFQRAHQQSVVIATRVVRAALAERRDLVLETNMGNAEASIDPIERARKAGYRVVIVGFTADQTIAQERVRRRSMSDGRVVPEEVIAASFRNFAQHFRRYAALADEVTLLDTSRKRPRRIAYVDHGKLYVTDRDAFDAFTASGRPGVTP